MGFVLWVCFVFEKMRIFIAFEESFEPFEVSADETVEAVKRMIKVRMYFVPEPLTYILILTTQ